MKISSYYVPPPTPPKYANSVEISTHVQGLHDFPLERRDWNVAVLLQFFREGRCFQFKYLKMFHILGGWCSSDWELILNMKTSQEYVASEDVSFSLFFFFIISFGLISVMNFNIFLRSVLSITFLLVTKPVRFIHT